MVPLILQLFFWYKQENPRIVKLRFNLSLHEINIVLHDTYVHLQYVTLRMRCAHGLKDFVMPEFCVL
jgi:hypothetical protein